MFGRRVVPQLASVRGARQSLQLRRIYIKVCNFSALSNAIKWKFKTSEIKQAKLQTSLSAANNYFGANSIKHFIAMKSCTAV
jgi:hypothetical protein